MVSPGAFSGLMFCQAGDPDGAPGAVQGLSQLGSDTAEQQTGDVSWKSEGTSPTAWKGALQTPGESRTIHEFPTSCPLLFFTSFRATEAMKTSLYLHHLGE